MGDYSVKAVLSAVDRGFTSTLKGAAGAIEGLGSRLKNGMAFGAFASMGAKAFDSVVGGAKSLVGEIDQSNAAWKTFTSNMSMLGKGADEIDSVKKELQSFAQETIYSSSDMASTFAQLEAVGTKNTLSLVKGFGGLAAAAGNPAQAMKTLSMQATQMAAKPKVAWEDFKLILDQTPAGVAAVAKEMGMSAQEMVTAVQEGKVKTEDFFNAISKVGTNEAFTDLATEAKTAGQAMDGLKETVGNKLTPAFDMLSGIGIKAVNRLAEAVSSIDGEALTAKLSTGINFVIEKLNQAQAVVRDFVKSIADTGAFSALKNALFDVGGAISHVIGSLASSGVFQVIGKVIGNVVNVISKATSAASNFISSMKPSTVTAAVGGITAAAAGFKAFNFLKSFNPFRSFRDNAEDSIDGIAKITEKSGSLVDKIFNGISKTVTSAGKGVASAAQGIGKGVGAAFKGIGAGLKLVKPAQLIALGTAIAIVNAGFALLATQGEGVAAIIRSFGEAIAAAAPFVEAIGNSIATVLAVAITAVANAMLIMAPILPIIAQSLTMLSPLVTALGEAFSIAASGVGTAISMIISAVVPLAAVISEAFTQIASVVAGAVVQIVQAIAPILPEITSAFTQITSIISNAIVAIVQAIAPYTPCLQAMVEATSTAIQAVCTAFSNLVSQIAPVIDSVTSLIEQLGEGISQTLSGVSDIVSSVGETVAGVMESIGGAISSVIDSISGVFDSLGNAALNAGTGFEKLANGLEIIVDLPFFDLAGSLAAVAAGLGGITILSGDLESLGSGMQMFSDGLAIVSSQGLTASTAFTSLAGTILPLASSVPQLAPAMLQAGEAIQTFAAGALIALASLVTSAASVTAFSSNLLALVATAASAAVAIILLTAAAKSVETGMKAIAAGAKNADRSMAEIANSATDVGTVLKKLSSIGKQALKVLAQAFDDTAKRAQTAGKKTGTGYAAGIQSGLAKAPSVALMAVSAVYSALSSGYSQAYAAGAYISRGFAQGMLSCLGIIRSAAAQMAAAADEAVRAKAKIHSPSRVADKLGGYWGSGLAGGILGKVKEVWNAAEKLISIPAIQTPDLQLAYAGDMSADYEYYRNTEYTIVVPVEIDGREVARTTAPYTEEELNKRQRREQRKHGKA